MQTSCVIKPHPSIVQISTKLSVFRTAAVHTCITAAASAVNKNSAAQQLQYLPLLSQPLKQASGCSSRYSHRKLFVWDSFLVLMAFAVLHLIIWYSYELQAPAVAAKVGAGAVMPQYYCHSIRQFTECIMYTKLCHKPPSLSLPPKEFQVRAPSPAKARYSATAAACVCELPHSTCT